MNDHDATAHDLALLMAGKGHLIPCWDNLPFHEVDDLDDLIAGRIDAVPAWIGLPPVRR